MTNAIVTVLKDAAGKIEHAIAQAGRSVGKHFGDTGTGLRKSAEAHVEHDAKAAKDLERAATHRAEDVAPHGGTAAPRTRSVAGPSTSRGWEGEGLTLDAAANAKVDAFRQRALAAEPKITSDIDEIVQRTGGASVGRDFRNKGEDSLKRKVATETLTGKPVEQALDELNDSVRYTMTFPADSYAHGAQQAVDALQAKGYQPIDGKFKNTWGRSGYKGINSNWVDPSTGQRFEVQFHTPTSFEVKDSGTHHIYEELRLPSTTPERRAELARLQNELFDQIPIPPGAADVRTGGAP